MLKDCWRISHNIGMLQFSCAPSHTAKRVQLNPTTGTQMSTSECRNSSRYMLSFSMLIYLALDAGIFELNVESRSSFLKPTNGLIIHEDIKFFLDCLYAFAMYHILHQWVPQFSFVISEEKGFPHWVSYLAIIFIDGLSIFVMLEIITISTLFTFFMPSMFFKFLVQPKGLFNFSLNRNHFLLLIRLLTLSTFSIFFFINYIRFLSMKCQKCTRYLRWIQTQT